MKTTLLIVLLAICGTANAQYTKLFDFNGTNGRNPAGALMCNGNVLYGMTKSGGVNYGNIFKIKRDGTGYSTIHTFHGYPDGVSPRGAMIYDGTFLYGMTASAAGGAGAVFKIKPDGSENSALFAFTGPTNVDFPNGGSPLGSLISDGTYFYGLTSIGGANTVSNSYGDGTVFKMKSDGSDFALLHSFNDTTGSAPNGSLISDGTFLYGMTAYGGIGGAGVIFKIKPDGTNFSKLLDFTNDTLHGTVPNGSLVFDGKFLYGMTYAGGSNDMGTVFKIKTDGSGYVKLLDFTGLNGSLPKGSLILDRNVLYGMTSEGGLNNMGVVFKLNPEGCRYTTLLDFAGEENGATPYGDLLSDGTFLYGMTSAGGTTNNGTVFKIPIPGNIVTQSPTLCKGQSFTVGKHTYVTTGIYLDTLTSVVGCGDSIVSTHLTVLSSPSITSTQTLTICSRQSVTVGTDNYTTAGTYRYTFQGSGCDSTVITNLSVNPTPDLSISGRRAICMGNGTTLTASGGGNYSWSTGSTADSIVVSPTTVTTYSVIATLGSCTDTSTVEVTVNDQPVAKFNVTTTTCCTGIYSYTDVSVLPLSDTVISWYWSLPGVTPPFATKKNISVRYNAIGYYPACLTITTAHGCTDSVCHITHIMTLSVDDEENKSFPSISPNPFTAQTTLATGDRFENASLAIFNSIGQLVKQMDDLSGKTIILDRDNLPKGLYFIRLMQGNKIIAMDKLVIIDN
jgi:uncharacterized repeat protein (TIGR03803 family)